VLRSHNINEELRTVENLYDYEAAVKIIMAGLHNIGRCHPLDYCYQALDAQLTLLVEDSEDSRLIRQYIANSKVAKPGFVKGIFAVRRRQEPDSLRPLANRRLLWHASKVSNYIGIFKLGLRIGGVTSSQMTGQQFGSAVYFADLFRKSWDYSYDWDNSRGDRYVLLCEVALGKIECNRNYADACSSNTYLKRGFDSIKVVGSRGPDPKKNVVLADGLIVPLGEEIDLNAAILKKQRKVAALKSKMQ